MIECIFTIDYEIYGNGEGSLQQLVYEPAVVPVPGPGDSDRAIA